MDGAIHRATLLLLAEAGYEGLSIAQVARLAGTATTSVYRRFPGKQELVVATLRNELRARPGNPPDRGSLRADLIEYVSGIVSTLTPQSARIMAGLLLPMRSNAALAAVVRQEVEAMRSSNWQIILDRAVACGEITQDHPGISNDSHRRAYILNYRTACVIQLAGDNGMDHGLTTNARTVRNADATSPFGPHPLDAKHTGSQCNRSTPGSSAGYVRRDGGRAAVVGTTVPNVAS
ncbi:TetR/AcrR family transcriptional regulator [Actinacidiphila soli]|uniref:TetR/AcrR family transcriptional regulator n=1 Tax=Actinacidiphila soli TaxID=2487275 RepID=UPI0013E3D79C|nr:TetR/AcrR family transcriptional regulator [Actinacidiphila soli]